MVLGERTYDSHNGGTSVGAFRYTVPENESGIYEIKYSIAYQANVDSIIFASLNRIECAVGNVFASVQKNVLAAEAHSHYVSGTTLEPLAAGDTIVLCANALPSTNITVIPRAPVADVGSYTYFTIKKVSDCPNNSC